MSIHVPVMIEVKRADGSQELVRVGTAKQDGAGFILVLSELRVLSSEMGPPPPPGPTPPNDHVTLTSGTAEELQYIATRARKTLADPSKSRWHGREREILKQAESELARLAAAKPHA
jgi:hypothetical protein